MKFALVLAAFVTAALAESPLELARDQQDRSALSRQISDAAAAAAKSPGDPAAQLRLAVACSYLAEVDIELHDRKAARAAAEQGIPAAEKAVSLQPASADAYRILGTLYGQAITDLFTGLSYGPKAKDALTKAIEKAPASAAAWTAHGVGNFYLPAQLGGGTGLAIADFRKAIALDAGSAEAWLWLGVALRKNNQDAEARQAFTKSLSLDSRRIWVKQQLEKTPAR